MTASLIDDRALAHLAEAFESYIADPPDSEFQLGYLAALINLWRELGGAEDDPRYLAVGLF